MFYIFLLCNSCNDNTTYTGKTVNFRHSNKNKHVVNGPYDNQ